MVAVTDDQKTKNCLKFLCSYGGRILPRSIDGKPRYIGGFTRVLSVHHSISFSELMVKLKEFCGYSVELKCHLPDRDLETLISIKSDKDLVNIVEEYDHVYGGKIRAILSLPKHMSPPSSRGDLSPKSPFSVEASPSQPLYGFAPAENLLGKFRMRSATMDMASFLCLVLTLSLCISQTWALKPPVMTIKSSDGDIIDCVHVREQPAFSHPFLRNHKIQDAPAGLLNMINKMGEERVWQVWNQNGTSCPNQTVPIRRSMVGATQFKKKNSMDVRVNRGTIPYAAEEGHEYAIGEIVYRRGVYGTVATMNLWDPYVEAGTNEFSLSQIWLVAGHYNESDLNTIEVGWQVFPSHYHDNQPRLFIYWTRDTYEKTGCLNLECPGFVQVSSQFTIGGAFSPISSYGGNQYDITMFIWKDMNDGNWWLCIGSSFVGYWPAKLFTHLAHGPAMLVQWGGEVVNTRSYGQHTTTQMGSGHFAEEGFGKASFFRNLKVIDYLHYMQPVQDIALQTKTSTCYNAKRGYSEEWGTHFYYGGPGYNALCP